MNDNRIQKLNHFLSSMKDDFFKVNTPATASNEIASIYHFLPLEKQEVIELKSNEFMSLQSRFAIMNKYREFKSLLLIGKHVFWDTYSNDFNIDIDYRKESVRSCLEFLVDACYSSRDFKYCILFGEKLLFEIRNFPNKLFDPDKKNLSMALSMAYGNLGQFEKSDYYSFLVQNPEHETNKTLSNDTAVGSSKEISALQQLIGQKINSHYIQNYLKTLNIKPEISKFDNVYYYVYKSKGIDFSFSNTDTLSAIFLYAEKADEHNQFQSKIPYGITFNDTRKIIEEKLGAPDKTGGGGVLNFYCTWVNIGISITYKTLDETDMTTSIHHITLQ